MKLDAAECEKVAVRTICFPIWFGDLLSPWRERRADRQGSGWILIGGFVQAGMINATGLPGLQHPLLHVTGTASPFATSLVRGDYPEIHTTGLRVVMLAY